MADAAWASVVSAATDATRTEQLRDAVEEYAKVRMGVVLERERAVREELKKMRETERDERVKRDRWKRDIGQRLQLKSKEIDALRVGNADIAGDLAKVQATERELRERYESVEATREAMNLRAQEGETASRELEKERSRNSELTKRHMGLIRDLDLAAPAAIQAAVASHLDDKVINKLEARVTQYQKEIKELRATNSSLTNRIDNLESELRRRDMLLDVEKANLEKQSAVFQAELTASESKYQTVKEINFAMSYVFCACPNVCSALLTSPVAILPQEMAC